MNVFEAEMNEGQSLCSRFLFLGGASPAPAVISVKKIFHCIA